MRIPHDLYIDGDWRPSSDGRRGEIVDPATEQVVDSVPIATEGDVDAALGSAKRAWLAWRDVDAWSRSAMLRAIAGLLRDRRDTIAAVLTEEQGKPLAEARGELSATADQFDWFADEARRIYGRVIEGHSRQQRLLVLRQPIGPVAAFVPWNFPALLAARKMAPAIAAGCSIVIKPPIEAPRTVLCLAQACADAGLPAGVVNVITGDAAMVCARLIASEVIRKVTLTGSTEVGSKILRLCAEHVKPASMELGGHAPVLVFEDADVDRAAEVCARAKFRNNGQVCIAASRFFVQESVLERFTARFVEVTRSLRLGDGREPQTDVGPLANHRRLESVAALVQDAVAAGATLCCGGHRAQQFTRGFFFEPTVLTNVEGSMRIMNDEPFGPIAPITGFTNLEDSLARANSTPYGLAGYVFTRDARTAFLASEGLEVGLVGVNHLVIATAEAPFGGVKKSGFGREGGREGIEAYSTSKYVNIQL